MSYFKRFTDFLAVVGVFSAAVLLISEYMSFNLDNIGEETSKLDVFFSRIYGAEHRYYFFLILLLLVSAVLGRILCRFPSVCFFISFLPFLHVMNMFYSQNLTSQPMLYVSVTALHCVGNLYEASFYDRMNEKRLLPSAVRCANVAGTMSAVSAFLGAFLANRYSGVYAEFYNGEMSNERYELFSDINFFGIRLISDFDKKELNALIILGIVVAVSLILGFVWRGVYFLDAACAIVPFIYIIWCFNQGYVFPNTMAVMLSTTLYFICRVVTAISSVPYKNEMNSKRERFEKY